MRRRHRISTFLAAAVLITGSPLTQATSGAATAGDLDAAGSPAEACKPLKIVAQQPVLSPDGLVATGYVFNFDPLTTVMSIVPPAGWAPVNAPANELAAFGFPARPTDPTALADWTSEWQNYKSTATPDLCVLTNRRYGSTPNWAGMELGTSTRNTYFAASGRFNEPTWVAVCPHASDHSIWTGIGGDETYSDPSLIQTGIDTDQSGLNVDYGFFEIILNVNDLTDPYAAPVKYATSTIDSNPWQVNPGDAIRANVQYLSPGAAGNTTGKLTLSLFDITTGKVTPPEVVTEWGGGNPIYEYVHGHTAEWIDERGFNAGGPYKVDGAYYYLRKPTDKTIWSSASTGSGTSIYGSPNQLTNWIYSDSALETLENSSGVVNTSGGFYDYWDHCPGE